MIRQIKDLLHKFEADTRKRLWWCVWSEDADPVGLVRVRFYLKSGVVTERAISYAHGFDDREERMLRDWVLSLA